MRRSAPLLLVWLFACSTDTSAIAPEGGGGDASADTTPSTDTSTIDSQVPDTSVDMDSGTEPDTSVPPVDGAMPDAVVDSGVPPRPTEPFGAPRLITELSDPRAFDDDPTLTDDMLVIVFNSDRDFGDDDLFMSERASATDSWSAPRSLDELNTNAAETTPEMSGDGLVLYFASSRLGGYGGYDIYRSTRASRADRWSAPAHVDSLSSPQSDSAAAPIMGETITAIVIESRSTSPYILESRRPSAAVDWGAAVPLALGGDGTDRSAMLETTGLGLWFDSNRTGGMGYDIYLALRPDLDSPFGVPTRIDELASIGTDTDAWVSPDLRHIFFCSNRTGDYELYEASR